MRGEDPELQAVAEAFIDKVVPRLLRPLQTGGRTIKPSQWSHLLEKYVDPLP